MIKILNQDDQLLLRYVSDGNSDVRWIDERLQSEGSVTIRRVFTFDTNNIAKEDGTDLWSEDERIFVLGIADGDYYKINKDILGLEYDLLLSKDMAINDKTFVANRDISIFAKIDDLVNEPIVIGGIKEGAIPLDDFKTLLRNFPTSTELTHYARKNFAGSKRLLGDNVGCPK